MWSEPAGTNAETSLQVNHLANSGNSPVYVNSAGTALTASIASLTRYEHYEHGAGSQVTSGTSFTQLLCDGANDSVDGGLSTWNTGSSVFQPEEVGAVYTIRVNVEVEPTGGNPTIHVDFSLSGSDPDSEAAGHFRHHQSVERVIRNAEPHIHVHAVYTVFTDDDLYVSGGILSTMTTGPALTITSASVTVKEG